MSDKKIDLTKIRAIVDEIPESRDVFKFFAKPKGKKNTTGPRARKDQDLKRLRYLLSSDGVKISDATLEKIFKRLNDAGAGILVHGRHGKHTRFVYGFSRVSIAQHALGEAKGEVEPISEPKKKLPAIPQQVQRVSVRPTTDAHNGRGMIIKRAGFAIEVPFDATDAEHERIVHFLEKVQKIA